MSMTPQQIFDRVKNHLLTQNKVSGDRYTCYYRRPSGLKCAVGCLIADEAYDHRLEGCDVTDARVMDALQRSGVLGPVGRDDIRMDLLQQLQNIHDKVDPLDWPELLTEMARAWKFHPLTGDPQ